MAVLLRAPITALIGDLRSLRFHDLEATFERELAVVRTIVEEDETLQETPLVGRGAGEDADRLLALASLSPRAVIIDAWAELEEAARSGVPAAKGGRPPTAGQMGDILHDQGVLDAAGLQIYSILRGLRNRIAHEPSYSLEPEEALDFAGFARGLVTAINARTGERTDE